MLEYRYQLKQFFIFIRVHVFSLCAQDQDSEYPNRSTH